jgi:hypothetical protein
MTVDLKSALLTAFRSKPSLAGAGVVLVEDSSTETLREASAASPRICVILQQLDPLRSYWYVTTLRNELTLQVPKVGVPLGSPRYVCLVNGTHAAFVGSLTAGTGATSTLTAAAGALREVSQELKSNEMMAIQLAMQRENQVFSSVSNVLKTRHDTAKNSINNIR